MEIALIGTFLLGGGACLRWKPTRAGIWYALAAWAEANGDAAVLRTQRQARVRRAGAAESGGGVMERTLGRIAREACVNSNSDACWQAVADAVIAEYERRRWKAIESAPKDVSVLICVPDYEHYGPGVLRAIWVRGERWHTTCWASGRDLGSCYTPTHWTPIPAPPKEASDAE